MSSTPTTSPSAPARAPNQSPSSAKPHSRHHHLHHPHRHHRHRHSRELSKPSNSASAFLQNSSFGELLSPVKTVASALGNISRRDSGGEGDGSGKEEDNSETPKKKATWEDVEKERRRRRAGEEDLRTRLTALTTLATTTTRSLDTAHYALLTHISHLNSTLSQLAALNTSTAQLLSSFTTSTIPDLVAEYDTQIVTLQTQVSAVRDERIAGLERRMKSARERTAGLAQRVKGVQGRVEAWEVRAEEGVRRGRRRVGMLWGVVGSLVLVFVAVVVVRGWREERSVDVFGVGESGLVRREVSGAREGVLNGKIGESLGIGHRAGKDVVGGLEMGEDPRLRVFDEL